MSYLVLARKWRPRSFAELVGQEHVRQALVNALDSGRVHHAFLFTGTRGVGKTTIARILARALNCERGVSSSPCGECAACREIDEGRFVDLIEVDAASRTKVDDTRELLENVQYLPTRGRYKVYLIDEVHMLSAHSFNALLKTLEEPPPHVKFLLATTDPQKLPVTVLVALPAVQPETAAGLADRGANAADPGGGGRRLRGACRRAARTRRGRQPARRAVAARPDAGLRRRPRDGGRRAFDARHRRSPAGAQARRAPRRPRRARRCSSASRQSTNSRRTTGSCSTSSRPCCRRSRFGRPCRTSARTRRWPTEALAALARAAAAGGSSARLTSSPSSAGATSSIAPDPRSGFEMTLLRMLAFRPQPAADGANRRGWPKRPTSDRHAQRPRQRLRGSRRAQKATGRRSCRGWTSRDRPGSSRETASSSRAPATISGSCSTSVPARLHTRQLEDRFAQALRAARRRSGDARDRTGRRRRHAGAPRGAGPRRAPRIGPCGARARSRTCRRCASGLALSCSRNRSSP